MPRRKSYDIRVTVRFKRGKPRLRYRDPVTGKEELREVVGTTPSQWQREAGAWERDIKCNAPQATAASTPEQKLRERIKWPAFVVRYQTEHLNSVETSTRSRYQTVLNSVATFGNPEYLDQLDASFVSLFQSHLRATKIRDTTISTHLNHLRAMLNWGVGLKLIEELPVFPRAQRVRKGGRRKPMKGRPITPDEFRLLLTHVKDEITTGDESVVRWQRFIEGLYWSGLRLEEGLELHWTRIDKMRVDLDGGKFPVLRILAETEKGKQDRTYPIAPEFAALLRKTPAEDRTGYVFPLVSRFNRKTKATQQVGMSYASAKLSAIGKAAGIVTYIDPKTGASHYAGAHDLRRAFGTRWSRRVLPQILQQMMRHESIETTQSYYVDMEAEDVAGDIWQAFNAETEASPATSPTTSTDSKKPANANSKKPAKQSG